MRRLALVSRQRSIASVVLCSAIGWSIGGTQGTLAGFSVGVLAAVAPHIIGAYLVLAVVATSILTIFEADPAGQRTAAFVKSRPLTLDMGQLSGIVLLAWMVTQLLFRERIRSSEVRPSAEPGLDPTTPGSATQHAGQENAWKRLIGAGTGHGIRSSHVIAGSTWVSLGFVVQAMTGLAFWALAAKRFDQHTVGISSEMFTSLQVINFATTLGLPEMLARFGNNSNERTLFRWSAIASFATSIVASVAFVHLFSSASNNLIEQAGGRTVVFAAIVATSALAALADARLMVLRKWKWVFWRLTLAGLVRIPLILLPVGDNSIGVFAALAAPIALSAVACLALIRRRTSEDAASTGAASASPDQMQFDMPATRQDLVAQAQTHTVIRFAGVNWISHLAANAPQFVLPVIVYQNVRPETYASFFVAWAIAAFAFIVPVTIGKVLLAESSQTTKPLSISDESQTDTGDPSLAKNTQLALFLSIGSMAAATIGAFIVAAIIPVVYGTNYAEAGKVLPWIVAGGLPWAFTSVALANARARGDHAATVIMTGVTAVAVLGSAVALVPASGLDGAITAWAIGNMAASAVAAVVVRRGRWRAESDITDS